MHCQKSGLDIVTWALVRYQLWFRAGRFHLTFVVNLYLYFQFYFSLGQDQQ